MEMMGKVRILRRSIGFTHFASGFDWGRLTAEGNARETMDSKAEHRIHSFRWWLRLGCAEEGRMLTK